MSPAGLPETFSVMMGEKGVKFQKPLCISSKVIKTTISKQNKTCWDYSSVQEPTKIWQIIQNRLDSNYFLRLQTYRAVDNKRKQANQQQQKQDFLWSIGLCSLRIQTCSFPFCNLKSVWYDVYKLTHMFKANEERTNTPHNYLNICLGGRKKVLCLRTNEMGPVAALLWRTRNPPSWQTLDKPLCVLRARPLTRTVFALPRFTEDGAVNSFPSAEKHAIRYCLSAGVWSKSARDVSMFNGGLTP